MSATAPPVTKDAPANGNAGSAGAEPATAAAAGGRLAVYPAERRIQVLALGALVAAVAVDAVLIGLDPVILIGFEIGAPVALGVLAVATVLGVVAVIRRDLRVLAAAIAGLVLPALAERSWEVTSFRFVGSVLFGFLLLAYGELVHMTTRYEKWHRVADETRTSADALDNATDEYLRTFTTVFGASALVSAVVGAVFFALMRFGPAQHRASLDFQSFYGLVGAALIVFGALGLYALGRGADWSRPNRPPKAAATPHNVPEVDPDAID